jgi:hypothetical protein
MSIPSKPSANQAVGGATFGGGVAVIGVWLIPQVTTLHIDATEAAMLTAAGSAVVSALVRWVIPRR